MAYRILTPADRKKYKPTDIETIGAHEYLKSGVKPKGGVKEVQMVTMYGPTGSKQVVESGSTEASTLMKQMWGVKTGSYEANEVQKLKDMGLSDNTINSLPEGQRALIIATGEGIKSQYDAGKTVPQTLTSDELTKLHNDALNDPTIDNFYKETLRVGAADFQTAVKALQGDYEANKTFTERQNVLDTKNLTENEAAAGRAYSGFREQAQQKLKADQSAVIESSQRTLQQNIAANSSPFEKKYGTAALTNTGIPTIDGQTYIPVGGISGTEEQAKLGDVENKYQGLIHDKELERGLIT